ncbi:cyclin-dependent protein serine/threonine kinase regulator SSN8 [Ascoidea rubescens DSM 1968]|uniref:Cyclin-like protein n=1 Tax=Ascoidea rubescens DSM 1968 TaxID=1344418 RepID=A0A1D2VH66_9ASCO|nr:cyclin-like protein [Ascoidea rubescens DSM 1968]ODV61011.1 cyclin-like protein [Ascoidea rubescens DSM 1968]
MSISYNINLRIYLHKCLLTLSRKLNLKIQPVATAQIYLSRFLITVSIKEINLYLLIATCVYLACKIEESAHHIRTVLSESRNLWPEFIPNDITKLAEFEFYLIDELEHCLVVHHPYKSLIQLKNVLSTYDFQILAGSNEDTTLVNANSVANNKAYSSENNLLASTLMNNSGSSASSLSIKNIQLTDDEIQAAWSFINDSYITDLPLIVPPHIIAISSIFLSIFISKKLSMSNYLNLIKQNERLLFLINFIAFSKINLNQIIESIQEILILYESWSKYDEKSIKDDIKFLLLNR